MEIDDFTKYLAATGLSAREAEIRTYVAQGAEDVRAIMNSSLSPDDIRRIAAREVHPAIRGRLVTGIIWYLTSLAAERNQAFLSGAFLCLDPHGRLSAFFSAIGSPRTSSHLRHHSAPGCTGGIDLVVDGALPPLANNHRHVLFISIRNDKYRGNCLFLKPEPYGISGFRDFGHHTDRYVRSLSRRFRFGGNDRDGMRKERIPDRHVKAFSEAVSHLPDGESAIAEVGRKGAGEGIAGMHAYLTAKARDGSAKPALAALLRRLEAEYDFVSLRFGNEVCIDFPFEISRMLPRAPGIGGPSPSLLWLQSKDQEILISVVTSETQKSTISLYK
ncbi:hypothetical protein TRIATDRAFT_204124 [Trichoderma atroviride IMI 206040]|uniref:Uncharacterized protein n=1 Tax=Hypocrea atroviridis (strain ATCC 20476 / IMI 206040) TaxID=452589 RepID=G9P8S2_HYPAI|nr:uncharacterized protein TRIATDRAFT_204124 [Trichoderma atroviride IMI 206040]EHK41004.1 hypothetical protein TRIATDRAFT_204124 [Trichoderma atroviride IMI 206040]